MGLPGDTGNSLHPTLFNTMTVAGMRQDNTAVLKRPESAHSLFEMQM